MKKYFIMAFTLCMIFILTFTLVSCDPNTENTAESTALSDEEKDLIPTSDKLEMTLGEYKNITAQYDKFEVSDLEVENAMMEYYMQNREIKSSPNSVVKNGDTVNINYSGSVDGVKFQGGTAEGQDLEIGSDSFIPGFEPQIIGMKVGDTKNINVTFPPDYHSEELAGKAAVFEIKLNYIASDNPQPDKLTDKLVKELDQSFKTVKELEKYIRDDLQAKANESNERNRQYALWTAVLDNAQVKSIPADEVEFYKNFYKYSDEQNAKNNNVEVEEFVLNQYGQDMAAYNKAINEYAHNAVKENSVAAEIAKQEDITIDDKEYHEFIKNQVASTGLSQNEVEERYGKVIKALLLNTKVIEFINENGK